MKDPKKGTLPIWQQYLSKYDIDGDGVTSGKELKFAAQEGIKSLLKGGKNTLNTLADGSLSGPGGVQNAPDGVATPAEYIALGGSFITGGGLYKNLGKSLGSKLGSKFSKIFGKRTSNTLLKKADYLHGGLIAKGGNINPKKVNIATKNMGFRESTPYLHGSGSASLPGVKRQGLRPNSSSSVSMGGESSYLGIPNHININHISASAATDAGTSINYAMNMSGKRDYVKAYNNLVDKGKLKMTPNQRARHVELQKQASNRLENWGRETPLNKKLMTENFPVLYGINPTATSKLGRGRFNTKFKSDMGSEVGIREGVNLNEISNISVPKWKINEVRKMFPKTEIKDINKVFSNSPGQTANLTNPYLQKDDKLQFDKLLKSFK